MSVKHKEEREREEKVNRYLPTLMVISGRKMSFSLYPQRFFKVFLPHQSSHHLKFPSAFVKYLNYTTPFKSTIVTPNKSAWEVIVEKIGDNLYFIKGWKQFVQHNSLQFGDFLVFSYDGNNIFCVKIYGPKGCEKMSTYHNEESCQIAEHKDGDKELDDEAIAEELEDGEKASKEASEFESKYPFFKIVMRPSYVVCGAVNIPASFIQKHLRHMTRDYKGTTHVTLVCADKSWPVNVSRYEKNHKLAVSKFDRTRRVRKLCGGWPIFSKENALKAGDVCVFELVDRTNCVLKVSIFRCSESD